MSISATLLALGHHGYHVSVHTRQKRHFYVEIWFTGDDEPVARYAFPKTVTEATVDAALENILVTACKQLGVPNIQE